jgi:hypothetical protein
MSARRRPTTTMKEAVAAMEQKLGVKLKRTPEGFYEAELPKDHPMSIKAGNNRFLIKVVPGPIPRTEM